jgi:hypothetical protein
MIWHNTEKKNRRIAIKSIRFDYAVVKARYDEKQVDRPLPMQFNAADHINERIALIQTGLAEMLKYTRWITTGIAVIAVMVAIFMLKHVECFFNCVTIAASAFPASRLLGVGPSDGII